MGGRITNPRGGGGSLTDHQHTGAGDGGDTINARVVTATTRLLTGDSGIMSGSIWIYDGTTAFHQAFALPSGGLTATRSITLPDIDGNIFLAGSDAHSTAVDAASGKIGAYNLTGQTAGISAKKLANATPAGMYSIYAQIVMTTPGAAGTINLTIGWTSDGGAKSALIMQPATNLTTAGVAASTLYLSSGDITFTTAFAGGGSGTYALRLRASYMGV